MNTTNHAPLLPHDLLWGMAPQHLPLQAPAWAHAALAMGQPVVVRRQQLAEGWVAVGVRGSRREERLATQMRVAAITQRMRPEQAARQPSQVDWPAVRALKALQPLLDRQLLSWGVTGGVGFELASGVAVLHRDSDLDLLLRTPTPLTREEARNWLKVVDGACCRVDMQLETPNGAIALREWAGPSRRVLLKSTRRAALVLDPWSVLEALV